MGSSRRCPTESELCRIRGTCVHGPSPPVAYRRLRWVPFQIAVRDLRTLSGPWSGFWIQELVRGNMKLRLRFAGNIIEGSGSDPMGNFQITGMFSDETNRVLFSKEYGAVTV